MMKVLWELVCFDENAANYTGLQTERMAVFGGWIVRTVTWNKTRSTSESSVFVPDAEHQWVIE
jgi:hypothetical protein